MRKVCALLAQVSTARIPFPLAGQSPNYAGCGRRHIGLGSLGIKRTL